MQGSWRGHLEFQVTGKDQCHGAPLGCAKCKAGEAAPAHQALDPLHLLDDLQHDTRQSAAAVSLWNLIALMKVCFDQCRKQCLVML